MGNSYIKGTDLVVNRSQNTKKGSNSRPCQGLTICALCFRNVTSIIQRFQLPSDVQCGEKKEKGIEKKNIGDGIFFSPLGSKLLLENVSRCEEFAMQSWNKTF